MRYHVLGKTGLPVSELCFGSLSLGPLQKGLSPEDASDILLEAFRLGINFVDTAQLYQTYPHIRLALKKHSGDIVVASKTYAYTAELAEAAVEEARRGLDREVIDIFLLHEQESEHTLRGHAAALERLRKYQSDGVIKAVGLSTHHVQGVHAAIDAGLDVVHPLINIAGLGILGGSLAEMEAAITRATAAGLGVYTMKALGGGNLFSRAAEALRYALRKGHSLAIGMSDCDEVRANVGFLENYSFKSEEEIKILAKKRKILIENHCSACGLCVKACTSQAIEIKGSSAVCHPERCLLCGYCAAHCENFCIKII